MSCEGHMIIFLLTIRYAIYDLQIISRHNLSIKCIWNFLTRFNNLLFQCLEPLNMDSYSTPPLCLLMSFQLLALRSHRPQSL